MTSDTGQKAAHLLKRASAGVGLVGRERRASIARWRVLASCTTAGSYVSLFWSRCLRQATGLPITTDMAYCQYEFFGETFTTETVEQNTHNPLFDYAFIHHVDR